MSIRTYRELTVWKKAVELTVAIYDLTAQFPREELFGISAQMKRSAVSIPSNIAEGNRRGSRKDYRHFLITAYGSGAELETQIEITKKLPFGGELDYARVDMQLDEIMRMLNSMIKKLT